MNIDRLLTHIGYFDVDQCKEVIEWCKTFESPALPLQKLQLHYSSDIPGFPREFMQIRDRRTDIFNEKWLAIFGDKLARISCMIKRNIVIQYKPPIKTANLGLLISIQKPTKF